MVAGGAEQQKGGLVLVLRVVSARLLRNFDKHGKMDPQARVAWKSESGATREVGTTHVDWNAAFTPRWNFTCRAGPYPDPDSGDKLDFTVLEVDMLSKTFIGSAVVRPRDLWDDMSFSWTRPRPLYGPALELSLQNDGEETGFIVVQGILLPDSHTFEHTWRGTHLKGKLELSHVDEGAFETPVQRLHVSGGTAPFFALKLSSPEPGQSSTHFIGKDLAHAQDEVSFYEMALRSGMKGGGEFEGLMQYVPEYKGVLKTHEKDVAQQRELLVMRNFTDVLEVPRMVDIKIGQKTGQAGWQGKSRYAAIRQAVVDASTNSSCEGFRLEGFDSRPGALTSMDPLLDVGEFGSNVRKKAERVMLQRMHGPDIMMHFLDVHREPGSSAEEEDLSEVLGPSEVTELALHEILRRLVTLSTACHTTQVPQKWIGSSVALGFDRSRLPPRSTPEEALRRRVVVAIFDWGRSELNTLEKHSLLSDSEQRDRMTFWGYYVGGIDRLAWEAVRAYRHRYCCAGGWHEAILTLFDFDSLAPNDYIGRVRIPLEKDLPEKTTRIMSISGEEQGKLTYSLAWCAYPEGSRLSGVWKLTVVRAVNLPSFDRAYLRSTVDAFVEVVAVSHQENYAFRQISQVKPRTKNPEWGETFELPVAAREGALMEALAGPLPDLQEGSLDLLFPMDKCVYHTVHGEATPHRCGGRTRLGRRGSNASAEAAAAAAAASWPSATGLATTATAPAAMSNT